MNDSAGAAELEAAIGEALSRGDELARVHERLVDHSRQGTADGAVGQIELLLLEPQRVGLLLGPAVCLLELLVALQQPQELLLGGVGDGVALDTDAINQAYLLGREGGSYEICLTNQADARLEAVVNGEVRVKLYKGNVIVVGRKSADSLFNEEYSTFEEDEVYNQKDAEGFIKLNALRFIIAGKARK